MELTQKEMQNYTMILHEELIPAMGCTEPIAIAYAAAKAKSLLPEEVEAFQVRCSGNIIKNVKGVTVPQSGGLKGIPAAAALGICGGDAEKVLEVVANVTDADRTAARDLLEKNVCTVDLAEGVPGLYIDVTVKGKQHSAQVILSQTHTNIAKMVQDGKVLVEQNASSDSATQKGNRDVMSLAGILEYAKQVNLDAVRDVLEQQWQYNSAISNEGLEHPWGAQVGRTIQETGTGCVMERAEAAAAAGSDARMSGCPKPVVINSGSGNQGITVTMPVLVYAKEWKKTKEETLRALLVSNLISIYIKHYIGPLTAFCGAVSAACGSGAAVTWMASQGDYHRVAMTITNTLCNVGGIACDGAKPSCAAKIAASVHAALMAHAMSMREQAFQPGEGLVGDNIETTIKNIGYLGKEGMKQTDIDILKVMIGQVDVDKAITQ